MAIVRWDPFSSRWPSLFDEGAKSLFSSWDEAEKGLDVYEKDGSVVVKANLPGIPEDKIDVSVEDGVLSIRGEYEDTEEENKKRKYYRKESKSSFYYSTALPTAVDFKKVDAVMKDGVVTVTIPKAEESKPKKITVRKGK